MVYCGKGGHPLDKVEPCQVLFTCFKSLSRVCRFSGICLVNFDTETGLASFKFFSWSLLAFLNYIVAVGITSGLYLPVYLSQQSGFGEGGGDVANAITDNLFIGGQMFGVIFTILLIPFISHRVAKLWNKLAPIATFLVENGQKDIFKRIFIRSRVFMALYTLMMNCYGVVCWREFSRKGKPEDYIYLPESLYWLHAVGLISFFVLCFGHIFHVVLMQFFVFTIATMIHGLSKHIKKISSGNGMSLRELEAIVKIFSQISVVCDELGVAYGVYLLMELVVMITSVLMNFFSILSKFEQRDAWTTGMSLVGYLYLMIIISQGGHFVKQEGRKCHQRIQEAAESNKDILLNLEMRQKLWRLRKPKISAAGYFNVNRKLATGIGSTLATYLIVLVQVKLNMNDI